MFHFGLFPFLQSTFDKYRDFLGQPDPPTPHPFGVDEFCMDFGTRGSSGDYTNKVFDDYLRHFSVPKIPEVDEFMNPPVESRPIPSTSLHDYYTKPKTHTFGSGSKSEEFLPKCETFLPNCPVDENISTPDMFKLKIDVRQFTPEEIEVTTNDNFVVIEAKHAETVNDSKFIARKFQRRYFLPLNVDASKVNTSLDPSGFLMIEAPNKKQKTKIEEKLCQC